MLVSSDQSLFCVVLHNHIVSSLETDLRVRRRRRESEGRKEGKREREMREKGGQREEGAYLNNASSHESCSKHSQVLCWARRLPEPVLLALRLQTKQYSQSHSQARWYGNETHTCPKNSDFSALDSLVIPSSEKPCEENNKWNFIHKGDCLDCKIKYPRTLCMNCQP